MRAKHDKEITVVVAMGGWPWTELPRGIGKDETKTHGDLCGGKGKKGMIKQERACGQSRAPLN